MTLPRINLHDGKHKLIVAEDGERVLTPEQNEKYEASHPNARKEPMKANVYDFGGGISMPSNLPLSKAPDVPLPTATGPDASGTAKPGTVQGQGDVGGKHVPIRGQVSTHTSSDDPLLDASHPESKLGWAYDKGGDIIGGTNENTYDKGGNVQTPLGNRIADRAQEIYEQGRALRNPEDTEAAAHGEAQKNVDEYQRSLIPTDSTYKVNPAEAADRLHPMSRYGSRPGEKRLDYQGNVIDPTTPQGMGAVGPKAPIPTALGNRMPLYDDGGTVTKDSDDPEKAAAYRQAEEEVMNNAPLGHGMPTDRTGMRQFPQPQRPARPQYDTENPVDESKGVEELAGATMHTENAPLGPPVMNQNLAAVEGPDVVEASTGKTPLGPQVAPRGTDMNRMPGQTPIEDDIKQAASQGDMGPDVSKTPPTPQDIINMDKMDAMKSGDLVKLGMAHINERALQSGAVTPLPTPKAPTAQENLANQEKELKNKMINGATEQERFQAEKDLAELKRRSPWGSEGNHPGILGKIGHIAARIGEGALDAYAGPNATATLVPGSPEGLKMRAAEAEQGVEQAQKKQQQSAVTKEAEQQPALREEAQKLAAQKNENTLRAAGYKTDPTTGERVPLTYEEMSPQQQAVADKNESIQTLNEAKGHEQEAKAILEKYKADPNNAQNQAALQKLQLEGKKIAISAGNLGIHEKEFLRDTYGVDEKGEPIPGVQTTDEGKPVGTKISAASAKGAGKVTANQSMKADLAENVVHNVDAATKLIRDNPGLFGKVAGRFTTVKQMMGSDDPAIAKLGLIIHNTALATNGIHGLRSAQAIEGTEKELLNKFKNSPEATIAALKENRRSVEDFMKDGNKPVIPDPDLIPAGATHPVYAKDGKTLTGHVVNNKYVPLPKE